MIYDDATWRQHLEQLKAIKRTKTVMEKWNVSHFISQVNNERIVIDEDNREVVWSLSKQRQFIRDFVNGKVVAIIYLSETEWGGYRLHDGGNRTYSLLSFFAGDLCYTDEKGNRKEKYADMDACLKDVINDTKIDIQI